MKPRNWSANSKASSASRRPRQQVAPVPCYSLQNQLGNDSMSTLTSKASGLSSLLGGGSSLSGSLLSGISSMDGVQSAFTALGMDSGMIQQFVPVIMSFLENQGIGSSLLGQLQGLWTPDA